MIGHHFESFCLLKHSELCLLLYVSKVTENTYDEFVCFKSSQSDRKKSAGEAGGGRREGEEEGKA